MSAPLAFSRAEESPRSPSKLPSSPLLSLCGTLCTEIAPCGTFCVHNVPHKAVARG